MGPRCFGAGIGLLVERVRVLCVPGLVPRVGRLVLESLAAGPWGSRGWCQPAGVDWVLT